MSLKLMYITNDETVAKIAEKSGVDRIFVDMEYIGKELRQGGMNTVQNHHDLDDVRRIKATLQSSELLVRCNPIHEKTEQYMSSEQEINEIIKAGADYIMLPYFKKVSEVDSFLRYVDGRCKTVLLFETPEAVEVVDEILTLQGIDEVFIGLNDLSLGYHKKFMFEILADGTVEQLAVRFRKHKIPFGFGGIAAIGQGMLPAEKIIREHYRLFSQSVILSRSFCNTQELTEKTEIERIFIDGIKKIRRAECECAEHQLYFKENLCEIQDIVEQIKQRVE